MNLAPGHATCAGCGAALAMRQILEATGDDIIVCMATGCIEVTTTQIPLTAWKVPWIHVTFENATSVAAGVKAALDYSRNDHTQVLAIGGDGAFADIGFGALSGSLERGDDILIICYDNEAYSNTGMQRSGATPLYAATSTSPAGKIIHGKQEWKKDLPSIAAAHHIPYVATASIGFPADLKMKIQKAMKIKGPRFIHIHATCPVGWGFDSSKTIEMAKLAVQTRMWELYEIENGVKKITIDLEKKPVSEYLTKQKRFKHLTEEEVKEIQRRIDENR